MKDFKQKIKQLISTGNNDNIVLAWQLAKSQGLQKTVLNTVGLQILYIRKDRDHNGIYKDFNNVDALIELCGRLEGLQYWKEEFQSEVKKKVVGSCGNQLSFVF